MHFDTVVNALILGIVEGFTEFLPVSSTAHLLLVGRLLGFEDTGKAFEVLIQFGAILALLTVYSGRIVRLLIDLPRDRTTQRFTLGVILAFLPAAIVGVLFHRIITEVFFNSVALICTTLVLGGVVLLFIDRIAPRPRYRDIMTYPLGLSFCIGLFQCLSLIPGMSRSGSTIVGAMLLGADKRSAAEFSFFLAMPTMLGAFVFDLYQNWASIDAGAAGIIAIGFVAAFVSALVVVRSFVAFVGRYGLAPFGWWRILVGGAGLIVLFFLSGPTAPKTVASRQPAAFELAAWTEANEIGRQDRGEAGRIDAKGVEGAPVADRRL